MFLPVIMAGGSGTRLWPLSRQLYPKQFLALTGERSMLQETVARLEGMNARAPLMLCNEEHRFIVAEQFAPARTGRGEHSAGARRTQHGTGHRAGSAVRHPGAGRSGAAGCWQPITSSRTRRDSMPLSKPPPRFAEAGHLVTFGIVPDRAETGYGYIRRGAPIEGGEGFAVASFEEKPDAETAERYLAGGEHFWNSGMFMFRASRYLEELERFRPDILEACRAAMATTRADLEFVRVDAEAFKTCPSESIDYAVMEKTDAAAMVPFDAGWSDIGSWSALWEVWPRDAEDNALRGDVIAVFQQAQSGAFRPQAGRATRRRGSLSSSRPRMPCW